MKNLILVAVGGGAGAMARYGLAGALSPLAAGGRFPLGTFAVNVLGCLAAGILAGSAGKHALGPEVRLFLFTGFLGGFTTFSAFGLETVDLLQRHEGPTAAAYAALSVLVGVSALWLGMKVID